MRSPDESSEITGRLPSEEAARRELKADPSQEDALAALDSLVADAAAGPDARPLWQRLLRWPQPARTRKGVYLWGPPGRGKSVLMDCAFAAAPEPKIRLHFFEFFQALHRDLHTRLRGQTDPVGRVVRERFGSHRLVCFDEFHVHDIADAMLLQAFLEAVLELPGYVILTSNYEPDLLLDDSRFRERFSRALTLLGERFEVVCVDGGIDYRHWATSRGLAFLHPLNETVERRLQALFATTEPAWQRHSVPANLVIEVYGRPLSCIAIGKQTLWIAFDDLCGGPRSPEDYLDLTSRFETLIVSGVTAKALAHPWTAQRFVWLVDILYDRRTRLALSAEAPIGELVAGGSAVSDIHRLQSRLHEMASWQVGKAAVAQVAC